ncbi:MAG: acetoin utilization protein AcuC [Sphingorhabdus sp.]
MHSPPEALYIGSDIYRQSSFGDNHPLSYARQDSLIDICRLMGWLSDENFRASPMADIATLTKFHDAAYVEALQVSSAAGKVPINAREKYNFGNMENPIFKGVFERASTTVGGSILAAQIAMNGQTAFHPAGGTHHGQRDKAHGFCYFNDPVFAILKLLDEGCDKVSYIDIDAHHGDGVEAAFAAEPRVSFLSVQEEGRWPYSGTMQDQAPQTCNVPVPRGLNDQEFEQIMERLVLPYIEQWQPAALVITCGADGLADDPLSKMGLSNGALWDAVLSLVERCKTNIVLGGGGYNPWTTMRCWAGLWGLLSGFDLPDSLPEPVRAILRKFDSDIIDEEDRQPDWIDRLRDPAQEGTVRDEITDRINLLRGVHLKN